MRKPPLDASPALRFATAVAALTFSGLLLRTPPAGAQSLETGVALSAHPDVDELGLFEAPEHDIPPPPGLDRMSVPQALDDHLLAWAGGDLARDGVGLRIHAVHVRQGRVMRKLPGRLKWAVQPHEVDGRKMACLWTGSRSERCVPGDEFIPGDGFLAELDDARVRGVALSNQRVSVTRALAEPEELIADGVFDASRELRMGDALLVAVAPIDAELARRARGTVMLVMF